MKDQPKELMIALMQQKKNSINFSKAKTKFCFSLHHSGVKSYFYVNKANINIFQAYDTICRYEFCLGSVSKAFMKNEQTSIFLKW